MNSLMIGIIIGLVFGIILGFILFILLIAPKVIQDLKYWETKTDELEKENKMLRFLK